MVIGKLAQSAGNSPAGISSALEFFGFSESDVEVVQPIVKRAGRQVSRVRIDGVDWAFKRYDSSLDSARIRQARQLETHLASTGYPVARPRRTIGGDWLTGQLGARFSVHEWVRGKHITIADRRHLLERSPGVVLEFGSLLATLHSLADQIAPPEHTPDVSPDTLAGAAHVASQRLLHGRNGLISRWRILQCKPRKTDFDRWIIRVLPELADHAEKLSRASGGDGRSQWTGTIHHDINWENLVFDGTFHVKALLDFDNMIRAPREIEVGSSAAVLIGADETRLTEFLESYESSAHRQLDRTLIDLSMSGKCVRSIITSIGRYLRGTADDVARLEAWSRHLYQALQDLEGAAQLGYDG